ncbi:MarR family winged helix-turn-helix transcriptional regulator [Paenibacillus chartarius]|uniref:MarR family winged helix-turn-helix transcriptional regulator n=1 Tax=Paenibacillus chartarius TaxID=747481 RepID=A0ABV6DF47_9BACL
MHFEESLGFQINHAGRRLSQLLTNRFQPFEITTEQWTVLNRLAEKDGISQKELAQKAEKDPTNLTRILDQLERKGLVVRQPNASDRRSYLTLITDKGRALNEQLIPIEQETMRSVMSGLADEQLAQLRIMLRHITEKANDSIREMEEAP